MVEAKLQGFSLLETLVAIVLGILLISIISEVYLSLKKNFHRQKQWAEIQETGRFLSYYLNIYFKKARASDCSVNIEENSSIVKGKSAVNDSIELYQCFQQNKKSSPLWVYYFIENNSLYIKPITSGSTKQKLINGIKSMKIKYGVMCEENLSICTYLSANKVSDWNRIKSVFFEFVLMSGKLSKKWYVYAILPVCINE